MNRKSKNEIVVIGQKIQTRIEEINIFKLNYWKENPRVNAIIKQKCRDRDISDEDIEKELWEKDSVKDLFKDIERDGGLIDEILVKGNIVLEGNSRLCAYRHLYKKSEKKNDEDGMLKWSYIRARIIPEETSNEVVFSILGTWHIKGKTQWDTYEKAAYLKRMNTEYSYSLKDIADSISQTEKFVKDHIEAYDLMVANNVYTLDKFSYFYELVKNKKIKELASKEPTIIPNTIQAIKEDRFKRGEEIRDLPKILKDKKAKKEFFDDKVDFNDALETTKDRHPEHADSFYNNIKKVTTILQSRSIKNIEEIKEDIKTDKNKKYILEKFYREVNSFCKKVGIKDQK
ncbi:MAG TPA: hypothetical protein PL107_03740 [Candidatus Marinimicrobia bacterium]|jgi:hypothetical protein|nr:hypothetical protein [Candidatus Neomarinimicrobiota bacterium]